MIGFLIGALKIIFVLGLLITIHETGHFLVAKWCKVKVNEFAIGFGPTIWKKQGKETKYAIRLIPLGGFVNMEGEEERSEQEGSFSKASIPKRIAIVLAGGLVNIVFALLVFFILTSCTGKHVSNVVDGLIPDYGAETAGIQAGDKILKVNGKNVITSTDATEELAKSHGSTVAIIVQRGQEKIELQVTPTEVKYKNTGIYLKSLDKKSTKIVALEPKSPAEVQGLLAGDLILKINGEDVKDEPEQLVNLINQSKEDNILFTIERNGKITDVSITPDEKSNYYLGVYFKQAETSFGNNIYYAFFDTTDFAFSIVDNLKMLFTGNVSMNQLMGPVGISEIVSETNGLQEFISMLTLISLSLGVTNLLPFPPLDGGKVLILLIEWIRRKPLKEKTEISIQMLGFAVLIALSIYVTYNDILRIF